MKYVILLFAAAVLLCAPLFAQSAHTDAVAGPSSGVAVAATPTTIVTISPKCDISPEMMKQLDSLVAQLQDAQKAGDKDAQARIMTEIGDIKNAAEKDREACLAGSISQPTGGVVGVGSGNSGNVGTTPSDTGGIIGIGIGGGVGSTGGGSGPGVVVKPGTNPSVLPVIKPTEKPTTICTDEYAPVCGADGNSYSNKCYASAAGVKILYEGKCTGTENPTTNPTACTMEYAPVCGSDGKTYGNKCIATEAGMAIAYDGECKQPTTQPSQSGVVGYISYWWGKVDQHRDVNGKWQTDPDGVSGADIYPPEYCAKWFAGANGVNDIGTAETITDWRNRGNTGGFSAAGVVYECTADAKVNIVTPLDGIGFFPSWRHICEPDMFGTVSCPTGIQSAEATTLPTQKPVAIGTAAENPIQYPAQPTEKPLPAKPGDIIIGPGSQPRATTSATVTGSDVVATATATPTPSTSSYITDYYRKQMTSIITQPGATPKQQVEGLTRLRTEIDGYITTLLAQQSKIDAADVGQLVDKLEVTPTAVKADNVQVASAGKVVTTTMAGGRPVDVSSSNGKVRVTEGSVSATAPSVTMMADGGMKVGNNAVTVSPAQAAAKVDAKPTSMQIVDEGGKAVYKADSSQSVRILGVIPAQMNTQTTVDAQTGAVTGQTKPWWSDLALAN